jgi:hypothetical protein
MAATRKHARIARFSATLLLQFVLLGLLSAAASARAGQKADPPKPTNEECLACRGDSTMTTEVSGKQVSLYVSPESFKVSIHGGMFSCVDCHSDSAFTSRARRV